MEANFSVEEAACTCYAAKPLTFLPERRILFAWLAINNRKGDYMMQDTFWRMFYHTES